MTSKQRAYLKGLAMRLNPEVIIGKNGIGDNLLAQISDALDAHELVKINVLQNADYKAREIIEELSELLSAEPVQAVGNKAVLYRRSKRDGVKHIALPD